MNDNIKHDDIRYHLAMLCCQLRGLNPDYIAPGTTDPLWKTPAITQAAGLMMTIAGSHDIAAKHIELASASAE